MLSGTTDCCLLYEEHARETLAICILASTAEEARMEVLYESCCGLDVHKSSIAACILFEQKRKPEKHLRRFGCTTRDLLDLAEWLRSFGVQQVAIESTGPGIWQRFATMGHLENLPIDLLYAHLDASFIFSITWRQ
jgi:hypothetical protein